MEFVSAHKLAICKTYGLYIGVMTPSLENFSNYKCPKFFSRKDRWREYSCRFFLHRLTMNGLR